MAKTQEVIYTSEGIDIRWNTCLWDLQNGSSLMTFKGGVSSLHSLDILANEYVVSGISNKPLIHIWPIQASSSKERRMVCTGKITALATSPNNDYIIVATENKINVWQICTGNLMAVISKHYLEVTTVRFVDTGEWFVTAGKDNQVMVWMLDRILCPENYDTPEIEAKYTWNQHSLEVTDVFVEAGQPNTLILTVSLDQTCKIFDFVSGNMICSVQFETSLTSLTMDCIGHAIYIGDVKGNLFKLFKNQMLVHKNFCNDTLEQKLFKGHSASITCLALSSNGSLLVSGSHDQTARVWETESGHCMNVINHKGIVTNILIRPAPTYLSDLEYEPCLVFGDFKRSLWDKKEPYIISVNSNEKPADISDFHIKTRSFILDCLQNEINGSLENEIDELLENETNISCKSLISETNEVEMVENKKAVELRTQLEKETEKNKKLKENNFNLWKLLAKNWITEVEFNDSSM